MNASGDQKPLENEVSAVLELIGKNIVIMVIKIDLMSISVYVLCHIFIEPPYVAYTSLVLSYCEK